MSSVVAFAGTAGSQMATSILSTLKQEGVGDKAKDQVKCDCPRERDFKTGSPIMIFCRRCFRAAAVMVESLMHNDPDFIGRVSLRIQSGSDPESAWDAYTGTFEATLDVDINDYFDPVRTIKMTMAHKKLLASAKGGQ